MQITKKKLGRKLARFTGMGMGAQPQTTAAVKRALKLCTASDAGKSIAACATVQGNSNLCKLLHPLQDQWMKGEDEGVLPSARVH